MPGGKREGAGRPRKSVKHKGQIAKLEKRIADQLPELAEKALALANGVWVQAETPEGSLRVFKEPPDLKAITYLIDRILGKPRQALEHSGEDGGPLKILVEYDDVPAPEIEDPPAPCRPGQDPPGDAPV